MSRQSIKLVALLISTALLTSACAIGFNAATNQQKASGNGSSEQVDSVLVRNALIVVDPKKPGYGTFVGTVINTGAEPDKLIALLDPVTGAASKTNFALNSQEPVAFGLPEQQSLSIKLPLDVKPGTWIYRTLVFQTNAAIPMSLLVENNDGIYSDIVVNQPADETIN